MLVLRSVYNWDDHNEYSWTEANVRLPTFSNSTGFNLNPANADGGGRDVRISCNSFSSGEM